MNSLTQLKKISILPFLIALMLVALAQNTQAVRPPPDGGYPGDNTAEGTSALFNLTTGNSNTANGHFALVRNTTGSFNTATGADALRLNTTGSDNTATGASALFNNGASNNTADGSQALVQNTSGSQNTATGYAALNSNTTGNFNTANGGLALVSNMGGTFNSAFGQGALYSNTFGYVNTASGAGALFSNTTGGYNTAGGFEALGHNITGAANTANGFQALYSNTTGESNTAIGNFSLMNNTGSGNIAVGASAGENLTTGSNNIDIGALGVAGDSNTIRIGKRGVPTATYIQGISGKTVAGGVGVIVDANGQLGTITSSARFKEAIKPMDKASEAILALEPVTFRYKHELDPEAIPQFGLIAEQVEKVNPALVARDEQGKVYTVRYDAVNAMLLNEFLKEHRKVEEQQVTVAGLQSIAAKQEAINAELKGTIAQQEKSFQSKLAEDEKQIAALTSGLQKVSAQIETGKAAPQMVLNNP